MILPANGIMVAPPSGWSMQASLPLLLARGYMAQHARDERQAFV